MALHQPAEPSPEDPRRGGQERPIPAEAPGTSEPASAAHRTNDAPDPFSIGFLLGVLVGEGHFGGDGKQPQVTLRMHTDHHRLFQWISKTFPGGKLYGPYNHSGRKYYQWMARGEFLRGVLVPILDRHLTPDLDAKAYGRFREMKLRYFDTSQTRSPEPD